MVTIEIDKGNGDQFSITFPKVQEGLDWLAREQLSPAWKPEFSYVVIDRTEEENEKKQATVIVKKISKEMMGALVDEIKQKGEKRNRSIEEINELLDLMLKKLELTDHL
jgi:hypothetical protein